MKKSVWFFLVLINLFALSKAWAQRDFFLYDDRGRRDPLVAVVTKEGIRTDFRKPQRQEKLPRQISVSGILYNGNEYFAVINGDVVKTGQKIEELLVKEISFDRVILTYKDKDFEIILKKEKESEMR